MKNLPNKIITIKNTNNPAIQVEELDNNRIIAIPINHVYLNSQSVVIHKDDILEYKQKDISFNQICQCDNCGYVGNKAIWKGNVIKNNQQFPIEGTVTLLRDNTWDIHNITDLKYDDYKGQAYCPICNNELI